MDQEYKPNPFGDPSLEMQLKICSEGAQEFVTMFYSDVNAGNPLSSFYIDSSTHYAAANESADIVINGAQLASSAEFEALLETQRGGPLAATTTSSHHHRRRNGAAAAEQLPRARYEVLSFDAQPVNHAFAIGLPAALPRSETAYGGGCIVLLVSVMGTLHLTNGGDGGDGTPSSTTTTTTTHRIFTDSFVLWPNWAARGRGLAARREKHKFLVASHNHRAL